MPSFDVVSEINVHEADNAVNQARKEIETRYDFRGTKTSIAWDGQVKSPLVLVTNEENHMRALVEVLRTKLAKRGIALEALTFGKIEAATGQTVRMEGTWVNGIETEKAKEIAKAVKELKLKVQAQIQGEQLRVSGKNRDDLQAAIAALKGASFGVALQFTNFRE